MDMYVSISRAKCDLVQLKPFFHYGTINTRGKLLIQIPSLFLWKADQHPFINGHHLMFVWLIINIHTSMPCLCIYQRCICHMDISHFCLPDFATDKKYLSLIGHRQNSSLKQISAYSI